MNDWIQNGSSHLVFDTLACKIVVLANHFATREHLVRIHNWDVRTAAGRVKMHNQGKLILCILKKDQEARGY